MLGALAVETARLLASRSQAAELAVLHHWASDPVDAWIVADGGVVWINKDDLEVLVGSILVHPIGVEHTQVTAATADALLSLRAERTLPEREKKNKS